MAPKRIQRKRTKGWQMPPDTIYVGRPTKWGNPFNVELGVGFLIAVGLSKEMAAALAVQKFKDWAVHYARIIQIELNGKNLSCWCKPGEPCHADVLLEIANK
jgi:hypothetical protein